MPNPLDPLAQLESLSRSRPPAYAFLAQSRSQAAAWQRNTRAALRRALGMNDLQSQGNWKRVSRVHRVDHWLSEYRVPVAGAAQLPVFVLEPLGDRKNLPSVVALHGHGYGVNDIIGRREDGSDRPDPENSYQRDFAVALVRRGFLVAAPEINCFGRRVGDFSHLPAPNRPKPCHIAGALAIMQGRSILGIRVHETMRLIDGLLTHPRASRRIGVMGISGGGMLALFTAAIEPRITAAAISGYFCSWKDNIQAMHHCLCNYVPGMSNFGDVSDIGALVAPRPMLVEHGIDDDIMPIAGVRRAVRAARKACQLLGDARSLQTDLFPGGHVIHGAKAYPFLEQALSG